MSECFAAELSRERFEEEEWMNCYFRKLVSLYRKSPCLWKKDARYYLNSERRHRAYARIHRAMNLPGLTFIGLVLKIREMRRIYVNELKNLLRAESSCRRRRIGIPWFYDLHRFLYPYLDYDESVELHNIEPAVVEPRETCRLDGSPSHSSSECPLLDNFLPCNRGSCAPNSISSPLISLPEVKTRPRGCSCSCSRINDTGRQPNRLSTGDGLDFCCEDLGHQGDATADQLTGTGQDECRKLILCELRSESSSDSSNETDSDQIDDFSKIIAKHLRKLDKPVALKAQSEIQKVLANITIESKRLSLTSRVDDEHEWKSVKQSSLEAKDESPDSFGSSMRSRPRSETEFRRISWFVAGADGIDPALVDRSVTISIQPVSQSAGRTRTRMARFALAKRTMRAPQPLILPKDYPLIELCLRRNLYPPVDNRGEKLFTGLFQSETESSNKFGERRGGRETTVLQDTREAKQRDGTKAVGSVRQGMVGATFRPIPKIPLMSDETGFELAERGSDVEPG